LERIESKEQRQSRASAALPLESRSRWRIPHILLFVLIAASVVTAVVASVRTFTMKEAPLAMPVGDNIVQIFLGVPPTQPEIMQVAKSTADWHNGKLNPAGTEMWVSPTQEFWIPSRKATVRAPHLRAGDKLLQQDGKVVTCTAAFVRPIISDDEFVSAYRRIHGVDASIPIGEPGMHLSKVTKTFQNKKDEVYQIYYGSGQPPQDLSPQAVTNNELDELSRQVSEGEGGSVFVTAEHPYYVVNKSKFVPVKKLEVGDRFRDFKGNELEFRGKRRFISKDGEPFKVYNFEVADQHTYFAGKESILVHNLCSEGVERMASIFEAYLKKAGNDFAKAGEDLMAHMLKDKALCEMDYIDAASYATLRKANGGLKLPRPNPWRYQDNFVPDPRLVESAKAYRVEKALLTPEGMNRNVAVAKVKINGETKFLAEANQPFAGGSLHSEEVLAGQINELRRSGKTVQVEELFTERIPCTETGGCRKVIASEMNGANVFFWTTGMASKSKAADLALIYGL
jgi:hypothetical protein